MSRLLLIDNYDSFTFNLAQGLATAGAALRVLRNDALEVEAISTLFRRGEVDGLVLSPGPGRPEEAGVCAALLAAWKDAAASWPLFGVCLGQQLIGQVCGATVRRAAAPIHGKVWPMRCTAAAARDPLWQGLPKRLEATRYHSLVVARETLPDCLVAAAFTDDGVEDDDELMALRHASLPWWGVQFHPESIGSPQGQRLLENFVRICEEATSSSATDSPAARRR